MLKRKTPLRRSGNLKRGSRIRSITPERALERRDYNAQRAEYLAAHPFDQVFIAIHGFDEEKILKLRDEFPDMKLTVGGFRIPIATQIHHRNKARRARLNDERWWMSTSMESHDYIEQHKDWAREHGFLLPIQSDADGRWGYGFQALTTPVFMKARAGL